MVFGRRRKQSVSPEVEANRAGLAAGWGDLPWGTSLGEFQTRFPDAERTASGWWTMGRGHEPFLGVDMLTQLAFNTRDQLYLVALYPEGPDRERTSVNVIRALGPPTGNDLTWTVGDVEIEVKVAGVAIMVTHRRLASAG
jgi:hypothetical protein